MSPDVNGAFVAFFRQRAHVRRVPKRALGACSGAHRPCVSQPSAGEENLASFKHPVTGAAGGGVSICRDIVPNSSFLEHAK
jgi:hypothetical protein